MVRLPTLLERSDSRDPTDSHRDVRDAAAAHALGPEYVSAVGKQQGQYVERTYARTIMHQALGGTNWSAIQITTAGAICAVLDMLTDGSLPTSGFIRQEDVSLEAFLANRFGKALPQGYIEEVTPWIAGNDVEKGAQPLQSTERRRLEDVDVVVRLHQDLGVGRGVASGDEDGTSSVGSAGRTDITERLEQATPAELPRANAIFLDPRGPGLRAEPARRRAHQLARVEQLLQLRLGDLEAGDALGGHGRLLGCLTKLTRLSYSFIMQLSVSPVTEGPRC